MAKTAPRTFPSKQSPLRVLLVEHDPRDVELCLIELKRAGFDPRIDVVQNEQDFSAYVAANHYDLVFADYRLPDWTGLDALQRLQELEKDIPLILITGTLGEEKAVECIKRGVADYVLKGQLTRLPVAVRRALKERARREEGAHAVRALRESEDSFRLMFHDNPLPMYVFELESLRVLEVNDAMVAAYGYSREEFLSMRVTDFRPAEDVPLVLEYLKKGTEPYFSAGIWRHLSKQGRIMDMEIHAHSLSFAGQQAMLAVAQDVTQRRLAEEALRESEARYRGLFEHAPYGIYRATPQGDILDVNPALVAMLGYASVDDFRAVRNMANLLCDLRERTRMHAIHPELGRTDVEVEWRRKDGKTLLVRLNGRLAPKELGREECFEVMVEDVTSRRALEKQLRQAQKFEAIGELAGGIAHDFNNMVGAILGWAELGSDEVPPEHKAHAHFGKIQQQARRAAALTRQLLAFARRQILEPRNMDLNQSVTETLSLLEKVIGGNIELETRLAPGLDPIRADPTQFEQVLMNLCLNARDAMPQGGHLLIETSIVEYDDEQCRRLSYARPGRYGCLAVSDTGMGMDAATLDRIFEPFFTTKEVGKGTGLGLSTVYGVVKQHGGFVNVYSEPGRGSCFRIYLPVGQVAAEPRAKPLPDLPAAGGDETILIAEDHEGLREIARQTLSQFGYHVLVAVDGEQAVEMFRLHHVKIDLVLLDVILPRLGGPEAYSRMCEKKPGLPVLFTTGYSPDTSMLRSVQQQELPLLQKPYTPQELARKVREALAAPLKLKMTRHSSG
jgi:two-component system cell cycle sensor histidine kinase/response regulator CckA